MSTIIHSKPRYERTGRTVRTQSIFGGLPGPVQSTLTTGARTVKFSDGQIVQHRGDPGNLFYVIKKGHVKLGQYDSNGEMKALVILGPGDSFGEMACLGNAPRVVDAEAAGDAELLSISEPIFSSVILSNPELCREVIKLLAVSLQESLDHLIVYRKMPAPLRLARSLILLCEGRNAPVKLAIRHQELAELVGVSRVSIAKTLDQLERLGLLKRGYGELIVTDTVGLKLWLKKHSA
jgi:CRP/FNR family transcriptional regulator, cyclic AMP receptor protein